MTQSASTYPPPASDVPSAQAAPADIASLTDALRRGATTRTAIVDAARQAAAHPSADNVFLHTTFESALAAARDADAAAAAGQPLHPIAGLPVSVKDLYDIEGETTRAASIVRDDIGPAAADAAVVRRLRSHGAALVGRTNMTEFAFSGVGLNPHFGTPVNPCDTATARICGGSSSGAAASVALGLAVAALGSDTGGSIRIPAALCGLTGYKPTARRVSLEGAFPLSYTLDTACAMAHTVGDCVLIDSVIAHTPVAPAQRQPGELHLAVPRQLVLDDLEDAVALAFDRALSRLSAAGVRIATIDVPELLELATINAGGGFSAPEAYAIHRDALVSRRASFDPRVAARIDRGAAMSAADYVDLMRARANWIARVEARLGDFDAIACPTVPLVAPPIAPLVADDALFQRTNALLLRNTSVFNFLDGCSISLPCQDAGELPVGLMLSHAQMRDAQLLGTAIALESHIRSAGHG